jgi:hypothetical protein
LAAEGKSVAKRVYRFIASHKIDETEIERVSIAGAATEQA